MSLFFVVLLCIQYSYDLTWSINDVTCRVQNLDKKERHALEQAEGRLAGINLNVDDKTQELFDKVSFIFPCQWAGTKIIVLEKYVINPPYDKVTAISAEYDNDAGHQRVTQVLTGVRTKLGL